MEEQKNNQSEFVTKQMSAKEKRAKRKLENSLIEEERRIQKARKIEEKKRLKLERKEEKKKRRTRWFWFFILLLLAIILLTLWDGYRKQKVYKATRNQLDSLRVSEIFYKNKYLESDSTLNLMLSNYNALLKDNIENSKTLSEKKSELLRLQKMIYFQDSILRQVQSTISSVLSSYSNEELSVEMIDGKLYVTMRNKLLFPSGSSQIQSKGLSALSTLAKVLNEKPNIDIVVEGHTDNVPISPKDKNYTDNWDLSTARAVSVTRLLIDKYGVQAERVTAAGRSMFFPTAPNTTAAGRNRNRRIEIILTPNLEELYKLVDDNLTK